MRDIPFLNHDPPSERDEPPEPDFGYTYCGYCGHRYSAGIDDYYATACPWCRQYPNRRRLEMPNGGKVVRPDEMATYRRSEIAQLEASHAELLKACKAASNLLKGVEPYLPGARPCRTTYEACDAAIAKAEGKT